MKDEELRHLANKYAQGTCNKEEKKAIERFFQDMQEKNKNLQVVFPPGKQEELFNKILEKVNRPPLKQRKLWPRVASIAAALVVLFSVTFFQPWTLNDSSDVTVVQTQRGERKEIHLEDGSIVFMNANSSLTYHDNFAKYRNLSLKGEAFFQVTSNPEKPFIVTTSNIKTTVLGTSFNIHARTPEDINVSVNSGKVSVASSQSKESVSLEANQQVRFSNGISRGIKYAEASNLTAWKDDVIVLDETSLEKTAIILENWYDIEIEFAEEGIANETISGKFKDETLENVLASISLIKQLKVKYLSPKHIVIRKNTNPTN